MPGFAAFHVGIQAVDAPTEEAVDDAVLSNKQSDSRDYVDDMSEEEWANENPCIATGPRGTGQRGLD